jgi:hypothetical protein
MLFPRFKTFSLKSLDLKEFFHFSWSKGRCSKIARQVWKSSKKAEEFSIDSKYRKSQQQSRWKKLGSYTSLKEKRDVKRE